MSYQVQWMSETCHHNYGSCSALYSQDEGHNNWPSYKLALDDFNVLSNDRNIFALYLVNPEGKTVKRQENY